MLLKICCHARAKGIIFLVGTIISMFLLVVSTFAQQNKQLIKIGVILPLTDAMAVYGVDSQRMIELMTPVINSNSSQYEYRFILSDGSCGKGNASTTSAQKLLNIDAVQFMLVGCSGEILQIASILNSKKMPTIAMFASHPDVKKIGGYVFRTYPDADTGLNRIIELVSQQKIKALSIISEEASFTEGRRKIIANLLKDVLVSDETFKIEDLDFRSILLKTKAAKPQLIYLNAASPSSYQALLKQIRQLGITGQLIANEGAGDSSSLENLGSLQDDVIFISAGVSKPKMPEFSKRMKEFLSKYNTEGQTPTIVHSTYNALVAMSSVIDEVGPEADKVIERLLTWQGQGATGILKFNSQHDLIGTEFELQVVKNGKPQFLN